MNRNGLNVLYGFQIVLVSVQENVYLGASTVLIMFIWTESQSRRRVVCPIDPSHTVYEDKLAKHIKICNKSKQNEEVTSCPYFVPNFNQGDATIHEVVSFDSPAQVSAIIEFDVERAV